MENIDGYFAIDNRLFRGDGLFTLRVMGDSMRNAGVLDGEIAIVRQQRTASDDDIVVAMLDGEATLKRYFHRGDHIVLHPRDNARLLRALGDRRDLGNALVVVEHDRDTLEAADYLLDFGPGAGPLGSRIMAVGPPTTVRRCLESLTGQYLAGKSRIPVLAERRRAPPMPADNEPLPSAGHPGWLSVVGARENDLANITVHFPLGLLRAAPRCWARSTTVDDATVRNGHVDYGFLYFFTERIALRTTLAPSFWIVPVDSFRAGLWVYFGLSYYLKTKERVLVPVE